MAYIVPYLPESGEFREICPLSQGEMPLAIGAASLVATALAHGSRDNCTAVVAQYLPD